MRRARGGGRKGGGDDVKGVQRRTERRVMRSEVVRKTEMKKMLKEPREGSLLSSRQGSLD